MERHVRPSHLDTLTPFLRSLGSTGILVSPLSLGTVKIGRNQGVKYPTAFDLPSEAQVADLLRAAADLGINLIDTAPAYGVSEERLGAIMSANHWFGGRDRWVVSTKVGESFENGTSQFDFSPAAIQASIHRSLERLRIPSLDIVLLHSSGEDEPTLMTSPAADVLRELKRSGLVRAIGASVKTLEGGHAAINARFDVIMSTLNRSEPQQLPAILAARRAGVGVLIKKGLASGHAATAGSSAVHDALAYIFENTGDATSSIVIGTLSVDHLRHNTADAIRVLTAT